LVLSAIICLQVLQSEVAKRTEQAAACPPLLLCYVNHAAALVLLPLARGRLDALRRAPSPSPSLAQLALAGVGMNALLLASDWCFYRGLAPGGLSVGVGSALFNSQLCWAVAFSACAGAPAACGGSTARRWVSAAASVLAMGGVVLLSRDLGAAEPPLRSRPTAGTGRGLGAAAAGPLSASSVAACLCSALLYAAFEVAYKRSALVALGAAFADASCATACVGLAHVVTVTPVIVTLRLAGLLALPPLSTAVAGELALNAALALAYNATLNLAIARCSAVAVSAASVLAAPAALAFDWAFGLAPGLRLEAAGGALLVVVAGAVIVAAEAEPRVERPQQLIADACADSEGPLPALQAVADEELDAASHASRWARSKRGWPRWLGGLGTARAGTPLVDAAVATCADHDEAALEALRGDEPLVWLPDRRRLPRAATAPSLVERAAWASQCPSRIALYCSTWNVTVT
jgi:hypothetical protein